jgi:hypothetical protein
VIRTSERRRDQRAAEVTRNIGEPCGIRTHDPLIKRRGPVMSRPLVFLRSSAQARVGASVRFARLKDSAGLSAHSRTEIGVSRGCVQRKLAQVRRTPTTS